LTNPLPFPPDFLFKIDLFSLYWYLVLEVEMAGHLLHSTKQLEDIVIARPNGQQSQAGLQSAAKPIQVLSPGQALPEAKRLIVLVPNIELAQDARLPQRIWQLASPGKVPVVYLAIAGDYDSEMSARRRLTLLAAITRDKHVPVEIHIAHTSHWVEALRTFTQAGDIILSHDGQTVRKGWFGSEPLCYQLDRCLTAPIYQLSGTMQDESRESSRILRVIMSVLILGVILVGFFALDAQVINQLRGTYQQAMLLILLFIEVGAIWAWNGLVG
jgi:hypothetical protein